MHTKAVSLHDGYANSRVTIDINDWTDSGGYVTAPLKRFMILSQYSANALDPWRWNYDKEMSFLGALRVLGVTNSSIAGNLGISSPNQQLEITKNFRLPATSGTTPYGIIYKDGIVLSTTLIMVNNGSNDYWSGILLLGLNAGNFTMGSTATMLVRLHIIRGLVIFSLSNTTGYKHC